MAFRLTIGRRIGLGFSLILVLNIVGFWLTTVTLNTSRQKTDQVTQIYTPSLRALEKLNTLIIRTNALISKWVTYQGNIDKRPDKMELVSLVEVDFPKQKESIKNLTKVWEQAEVDSINSIFEKLDGLIGHYKEIMTSLKTFEDYDDNVVLLTARQLVEDEDEGIPTITRNIKGKLFRLIEVMQNNTIRTNDEMIQSFDILTLVVRSLGLILLFGGLIIAISTIRTIVPPVNKLKHMLLSMGRGVLPTEKIEVRNDEIGEMGNALSILRDGMKSTTDFAHEVGSGNFESDYKPLSNEDTLGLALLKMRYNLAENERILEAKVIERTEEVVRQKDEIETQNQKLAVLYKHVTDSIRYAKRIQESILPPDPLVKKLLPGSFVLYKPKDIVSGDFYWIHENKGKVHFAAVDCTGHGVPGAFMSIVGYNILKDIVTHTEYSTPGEILDSLNDGVSETLHQHGYEDSAKDGMDISFCSFDHRLLELEFAGAFNPLYLVRDGQLQIINGNKFPLGYFIGESKKRYTNHKIQLQKGDMIYVFSDGYADQFGGPNGKKFMASRFRELLTECAKYPSDKQKEMLDKSIEDWKGEQHEQVDDILVIGVRI